jgi:hypothetical protein
VAVPVTGQFRPHIRARAFARVTATLSRAGDASGLTRRGPLALFARLLSALNAAHDNCNDENIEDYRTNAECDTPTHFGSARRNCEESQD